MRSLLIPTTALLLCAAAPVAEPAPSDAWPSRWWPFGKSSVQQPVQKPEPPPSKTDKGTPTAEPPAAVRARELADHLRRIAVCDRLQAIAMEDNDTELARKAEQLELRAWEVYRQRTANLPAADAGPEQRNLERRAGPDVRPTQRPESGSGRGLEGNRTPAREVER